MAALAVGVVGEDVEQRHRPQLVVELGVGFVDREVVLAVVGGDEPLHRPFAERSVAQHRRRHDVQSEVFAQEIGGHFAAVETGLEVPQRALAPHRFVDGRMTRPVVGDVHEEGRVAAVGHAALDLDLAPEQMLNRIGDVVDAQFDTTLLLLLLLVRRRRRTRRRTRRTRRRRARSWPSVHPWAGVAVGIHREAAPLARRPTGFDDAVGVVAERRWPGLG